MRLVSGVVWSTVYVVRNQFPFQLEELEQVFADMKSEQTQLEDKVRTFSVSSLCDT